jgi:hypothetical protein
MDHDPREDKTPGQEVTDGLLDDCLAYGHTEREALVKHKELMKCAETALHSLSAFPYACQM